MRFDCGPGVSEKNARLTNWHWHFAWIPVRVGNHDCRWLERVERKFGWVGSSGTAYDPVYRPTTKDDAS